MVSTPSTGSDGGAQPREPHSTLSPKLIADYDLFRAAVPHHDEMQAVVGQLLRAYIAGRPAHAPIVVFEAGAGTGMTTEQLVAQSSRVRVLAVDVETDMIDQARERLAKRQSQIEFIATDFMKVLGGLANETVDVFATAFTLHHLTQDRWPTVIGEIARVLKPGGLYINADKIARRDLAAHGRDLRDQLVAFRVFDEIGKPELRTQWTRHYQADEQMRVDEEDQIRLLREGDLIAPRVVWRKRMEGIIVARAPAKP